MGYVAGVGAANADLIGRGRAPLVMRDSNPGFFEMTPGGVTRNILENLARLGVDARLVSAVGQDAFGESILAATASAGVDVSRVLRAKNAQTSAYCAILEPDGEMRLALSDMRILDRLNYEALLPHRALLSGADAVVLDPSLPEYAIDAVLELSGPAPVFADPVSTAYAKKLAPRLGRFHTLKPNRMELEILSGRAVTDEASLRAGAEALLRSGCRQVFVTLGPDGCAFADAQGKYLRRRLPPAKRMANATGAGDAFTAAALFGFVTNRPPEETLSLALAAGLAAVRSEETVCPDMSLALLERILTESQGCDNFVR